MAMSYVDRVAEQIRDALPIASRPEAHANELYRLYALLALVSGESTTLENVHDAWSAWMTAHDPDHESLRPFRELDPETRGEDRPYLAAIVQVARSNAESP